MEVLYLLVYLITECMNHTLIYILFFDAKISKSVKRLSVVIGTLLVIHTVLLVGVDVRTASAVSLFTMIIIPIFFFEAFKASYLYIYPFVALSISIVGICISYLLALILNIPSYKITQGNWLTIICQTVPMLVLIALYVRVKRRPQKTYFINLGIKQYIVFYVVAISLFLMTAPMQSIAEGDLNERNITVIGAATSLGCIALIIVTMWQGISEKKEIEFRERSMMFEEYLSAQREYYESLLQQEEKMRRFRHDMNAHVIALQVYATNNEMENIQLYLSKMISESAIYSVDKYTGNKIVDAVIAQLKEEAERNEISIDIQGCMLEASATKSYDLCIILSNLLKNAIEACEKIDSPVRRKISLNVNMYDKKIYINIKNSIKERVRLRGKYPDSTKKVSAYHGLGYGNLEYTVNKYKGMIECRTSEEEFEVDIII